MYYSVGTRFNEIVRILSLNFLEYPHLITASVSSVQDADYSSMHLFNEGLLKTLSEIITRFFCLPPCRDTRFSLFGRFILPKIETGHTLRFIIDQDCQPPPWRRTALLPGQA